MAFEHFGIESKEDSKDQELIQSSTATVPGYQNGKWQDHNKHHKQSQEVSPFSAGDHKALINRREWKRNKNKIEIT